MTEAPPVRPATVAVVDARGSTEDALVTIGSLRRAHPELTILAVGTDDGDHAVITAAGAAPVQGTLASAVNASWRERRGHVLVVAAPAIFPLDALGPAGVIVDHDRTISTVSFLSDGPGFLGLPAPAATTYDDVDSLTVSLRSGPPVRDPVPIPFAAGPAVLVSDSALSTVGELSDEAPALVDFSLRARRRGFVDVVDPSTFVRHVRPPPPGEAPHPSPEAADLHAALTGPASPLGILRTAARARVAGLRVLVDGSCLGPLEMGTQVQTVALVQALARRSDVASVAVALPGDVPPYARSMLSSPKVDGRPAPAVDLSAFGPVDILHQPFQPEGPVELAACGGVAARTVLTVLDLIAYRNRSYQTSAADWSRYRERMFRTVALVDGVVTPTRDAGRQVRMERLPVDDDRLFVVPLGTDHLAGDEHEVMPAGLAGALAAGANFVLVLGADYRHKNRDIAIRALQELRRRGHDVDLVMAGMQVYGSSRREEDSVRTPADPVHVLGDVASEERNWLLRHAAAVLYPTSAEGFGLVPFEAARFATPTVFVPFGPVAETLGTLPVTAADWSPTALADAASTFLRDPDAGTAQVDATLAIGARYTWDACAAALVDVYLSVLARPAVEARRELGRRTQDLDALRAAYDALRTDTEQQQRSPAYRLAAGVERLRVRLGRSRAGAVSPRLGPAPPSPAPPPAGGP